MSQLQGFGKAMMAAFFNTTVVRLYLVFFTVVLLRSLRNPHMFSLQRNTRVNPCRWKRVTVALQRGVWHAGYEDEKRARVLAAEIDRLLLEPKNADHQRLKELQQEYEKVTGEKYDFQK